MNDDDQVMTEYYKNLILFAIIYYIVLLVSRLAHAVLADTGASTCRFSHLLPFLAVLRSRPSETVESRRSKQQKELYQDRNMSTNEQKGYVFRHSCP